MPHEIDAMPASDYQMLLDFYQKHPFGAERDNIHSAQICAVLANIHRKKNSAPIHTKEFMIRDPEIARKERMSAFVKSMIAQAKPKNG